MLSEEQIQEARELLEASQNPLFLYDNDVDGFCAFIILRKFLERGKGVAIKSYPTLQERYIKKVEEFNSDAVIVLDKPDISRQFIEELEKKNIPLIWIDHHQSATQKELISKTHYFNSLPSAEPTTYLAQKIANKPETRWLALIGCIGDVYMPDFAKGFEKEFPELFNSNIPAFEALNTTEIGKMALMLNFGLMNTTTNVVKLTKYLFSAKSPHDLLEENQYTQDFHKRYAELYEFYKKQIEKAEGDNKQEKIIFFSYAGQTSMSSQIANRLYFQNPSKLIVVAFKKEDKVNVSIRGKEALEITKKSIENLEGATGGGHPEATGAMIPIDKFEEFKEKIISIASN